MIDNDQGVEISDYCQFSGCTKRSVIWCDGLAACEDHAGWLMDIINGRLRNEEEQ